MKAMTVSEQSWTVLGGLIRPALAALLLTASLAQAGGGDERFERAMSAFDEASASKNGEHPGYARAHEIWRELASEGDVRARYHIGILHMFGLGGAEYDRPLAMQLVRAAANGGYAQAQSYMGLLAEQGDGLQARRGDDVALEWWTKAAEGGHCAAVRRLARAYTEGELGLEADTTKAAAWNARMDGCRKR
jgi:TPR repeat protein